MSSALTIYKPYISTCQTNTQLCNLKQMHLNKKKQKIVNNNVKCIAYTRPYVKRNKQKSEITFTDIIGELTQSYDPSTVGKIITYSCAYSYFNYIKPIIDEIKEKKIIRNQEIHKPISAWKKALNEAKEAVSKLKKMS